MSISELDSVIREITTDLSIDDADVERRKSFFSLNEQDAFMLQALHEPFTHDLQQRFTDAFYVHLQSFDETRKLLRDDDTVERLKRSQAAYFNKLTEGDYGVEYVKDRLKVGVAHEQMGLSPQLYIGAYCQYLSSLLPEVWNLLSDQPERFIATWQALQKLVLFDISLAMETYVYAACRRIRAEHDLSEQARREAQSHAELLQRQEFEIQHLSAMAGLPSAARTAHLVGVKSLHESNPDIFESLSIRYEQLLDLAVDTVKYKTEHKPDIDLRAFANHLGLLKAGPRDLVEIHSVSLKKKLSDSSSLPQFYLEEGRLMVFEILGYLTSFYRNYYLRPREAAIDGKTTAHKVNEAGTQ
ncbi:MAG: protoglobin domain-containing protein [Methylobacter sp.]